MVPVTLPEGASQPQSFEFLPSPSQAADFDQPGTKEIIKQFLLRQFTKKEVRENEQLQVLTDVTLYDMQTNRTIYGHNEDTPHFAASVNKLAITMLVLEELRAGNTTLNAVMAWTEADRRAGNGVFDQPGIYQATLGEVLHDLLNRSGNTAARILVNGVLGGATATNNRLALVPEIPNTRLIPLDGNRFYMGNTTSKEALFILRQLMANQDQYGHYVKHLLATNDFTGGVRSQLAGNDFILLVNKYGLLYDPDGNNHHDVGIIYNTKTNKAYGYSYLTTAPSTSAEADARAIDSVANMGKYMLRFSGDKPVEGQQQAPQTMRQHHSVPDTKILY